MIFRSAIKYIYFYFKYFGSKISLTANVGLDCTLEAPVIVSGHSTVSKSTLEKGVSISSKVTIVNSVIKNYTKILTESKVMNCNLGNFIKIRANNSLINVTIGDYSYTSHRTTVHNATIGKFCSIGPDVKIGLGIHPTNFISTHPLFYSKQGACAISIRMDSSFIEHQNIEIGNDVWIGANVCINDGVKIGNGVIIAAGAVVTKDIPDYSIVGGVPAKLIKMRFDPETIQSLLKNKWWDNDLSILKKNINLFEGEVSPLEIAGKLSRLKELD